MTDQEIGAMLQANAERVAAQFRHVLDGWPGPLGWDPVPVVISDDLGTLTVGQWGGYWLQVARMLFNQRLLLTPQWHPTGLFVGDGSWEYGWCYPDSVQLMVALLVWDPQAQAEPDGFERRAAGMRVAGQVARGWDGRPAPALPDYRR